MQITWSGKYKVSPYQNAHSCFTIFFDEKNYLPTKKIPAARTGFTFPKKCKTCHKRECQGLASKVIPYRADQKLQVVQVIRHVIYKEK